MSMLSFVNGLHLFKSLLFCGRTEHVEAEENLTWNSKQMGEKSKQYVVWQLSVCECLHEHFEMIEEVKDT